MNFSALRLLAGSRWRQSMMAYPDCSVPMCSAEKPAGFHAFVYQFGGSSHGGLPMTPEGVGGWRCLTVEKLGQVVLRADGWHTAPRASQQTCIDEIDFDADAQPGDNPQKGQ